MGKLIDQLAGREGHEVLLRIDEHNQEELSGSALSQADVAIEFSTPEAAPGNLMFCFEQGVPVVCGTTGWQNRLAEVQAAAEEKRGTLLYASNFSIGVNLFFALNRFLAERMDAYSAYEPQIEETHHTEKLDAPSGTAITLAEELLERLARKDDWVLGITRDEHKLPICARRIGQVRGLHSVRYDSPVDSIRITHEAHSREGFARGALAAAQWVVDRVGVFTMRDMLGF